MIQVSPEGARLIQARKELAQATETAREAVRREVAAGMTESEAAAELAHELVDRAVRALGARQPEARMRG